MAVGYNPRIVTDGLVLALDAGNTKSYPGSGSTSSTITYVGGTSDFDNSTSFTLSGLQSGDLVLYFSAEDNASVATPTGASWTAIPGLTTQPNNNSNPNSAAFYVFATGTSVTASGLATGDNHIRVMIAFRNVNPANPFDVNATENSASGSLPNPPSITPVTNNSMIVAVGLLDDDDVANTITPPTGYTTALTMDSQGGATLNTGITGATIMTAYKLLATAAAEDPGAFISSSSSAGDQEPNKGISIALRPGISSTWTDLSGKGNTGTISGATHTSGVGGYFAFDGSGDYVSFASASELQFLNRSPYALEVWMYPTSNPGGSTWTGIFNREDSSVGSRDGYNIYLNGGSGTLYLATERFQSGTNNSVGYGYNDSDLLNIWSHIVATYDGTTLRLYRNGVQLNSTTSTGNITNTSKTLEIGRRGTGSYFIGRLTGQKIYNKALSASEVQQNYNALRGRFGI